MIYKVSRTVGERELDTEGRDTIFRGIIHKLVDDISIPDLETIFKMSQDNGDEFTPDLGRTRVFHALYNTNIPKTPFSENGSFAPVNVANLTGELILFSILNSEETSTVEYSDNGMYTLDSIMEAVCKVGGVDKNFVLDRIRKREHVLLRHQFYYIAHRFSTCTLDQIGQYLGYDHATVIHGSKQIVNALNSPGEHKLKTDILLVFNKLRMPEAV